MRVWSQYTAFPSATPSSSSFLPFSSLGPSHWLQSFTNCSSMGPLNGLKSFRKYLLQHVSPTGCRFLHGTSTCSSMGLKCEYLLQRGPPWAAGRYVHRHGLSMDLQGNLCSSIWSSSSLSFSTDLEVCMIFFSHFFPHSYLCCSTFCPFLNCFPEVLLAWLRGSAVPCSGFAGAGWNQLCPAQGSP